MTRDQLFQEEARALGVSFDGDIKIGGHYVPVVRDGDRIYVSGQIPRVGDEVVCVGAVGGDVTLDQARRAAGVCAIRALALLMRTLGSLDRVVSVPRITVLVRSSADFTQQSEVADSASDLLFRVLGPAGAHTRTSAGVLQLPKGASVEVDLIAVSAGPA